MLKSALTYYQTRFSVISAVHVVENEVKEERKASESGQKKSVLMKIASLPPRFDKSTPTLKRQISCNSHVHTSVSQTNGLK